MGVVVYHSILIDNLNENMKLCVLAVVLVAGVLAEPESKPYYGAGYGGYGSIGYGYGGLGGYGGYGHGLYKRDAEPLSVLDILTMDATVLVGALLDLNLDHYGRKKRDADAEALSVLDVLTMDATVLVGALQALKLDHYGRKKRDATAVAESKPYYGGYGGYGYGGYGGYGSYGGYGGYGRYRRDAQPLSALDILTMDSTVLVQALQDLKLDHYGKK